MNAKDEQGKIWFNGKYVAWREAKIHVLSHVVHYGSSVFEGIRCYQTKRGPAIFRLTDHLRRLYDSAKIYRMEIPYTFDEIQHVCIDIIKVNNLTSAYLRPVVFRGYHKLGVDPTECPVETVIAVMDWGRYLGEDALDHGVDVKVSSWQRMFPNTLPFLAKSGANYMNSQLIKMEALLEGYSEGIALNPNGTVSEGSGENIFLIRDNRLFTPPIACSALPGITRDTVIHLARELGYSVEETEMPREMLYIADELFFSGTAAEISPIRSVDKITIGNGSRGPVTEKIQKKFFEIIETGDDGKRGWLTFIK